MTETTEQPLPTWNQVRQALLAFAESEGEWAGAPIPVDTLPLCLEKRYPWPGLQGVCWQKEEAEPAEPDFTLRNYWHDRRLGADVFLCEFTPGKVEKVFLPARRPEDRLKLALSCLEPAAVAWDVDAEWRALAKLEGLVPQHTLRHYLLTGMFLETSPRSGVTYLFRKLRPTVALRPSRDGKDMRILAALCLHPLGYYEGSHAGVMCPTDCVLAHLLLMRADEHLFWRKSNQHPPEAAESGI